jgi:hypothetical protein
MALTAMWETLSHAVLLRIMYRLRRAHAVTKFSYALVMS